MKLSDCIVWLFVLAVTAGCAKQPEPQLIAPVRIEVTKSDFCEIMRSINGPAGKVRWSVRDTPETITSVRRLAAAFDRRCQRSPNSSAGS